jgi:hypothetical protein
MRIKLKMTVKKKHGNENETPEWQLNLHPSVSVGSELKIMSLNGVQ